MSNVKKIGIAVGAAVVIGGASAGGYMLMNKDADSTSESAEGSASPSVDEDLEPAPMKSMAAAMPEKIDLYVEVPSVRALAQGTAKMKVMNVGLLDLLSTLDEIGAGVGKAFGLDARDGSALVSSFKSAAFGIRFDMKQSYGGFMLFTDKPAITKKWLGTKRFKKDGKIAGFDKYALGAGDRGAAADDIYAKLLGGLSTPRDLRLVLLPEKGLLLGGTDAFLEETIALSKGKGKALASTKSYQADLKELDPKPRLIAYVPASGIDFIKTRPAGQENFDDFLQDTAPVLMGFYMDEPGMNMVAHFGLGGAMVPKLSMPKPGKLDLAGQLPADAIGYLGLSTKIGLSGTDAEKRLVDIAKVFDLSGAADLEKNLAEAKKKLGFGLSDVVDALGDQMVIGFMAADEDIDISNLDWADFDKKAAIVGLQEVKDLAGMKKVLTAAKGAMPLGTRYTVTATADGGFEAKPKRAGDPFMALRYPKGHVFIGIGAEALVLRAHTDIESGAKTLAGDKAHALGLSAIPGNPYVLSWYDVSRVLRKPMPGMEAFPAVAKIQEKIVVRGDNRFTMTTALGIEPKGSGYRFRLDMLNSAGILPGLGIYGMERYLASSKTSEAKNTIGAISRGAAAAYEREHAGGATHKLCKSSIAVPPLVPKGMKYAPKPEDFQTGDSETGWKCLKFAMTQPHYFQYGYTAGGPYKGPAVGGPDPGKDGYEAWAMGDLDGDGVTSLFTATGKVDPATGKLKRATQIFIHNEHE